MKRGVWLLLLLGLALPGLADESKKPRVEGPRIVVEPSSFDFGEALQNKTLHKEFLIRNHGSKDLLIKKVTTDCGCTAALLEDTTLEPGESAPLRVSLDTRSRSGPLKKRVLIQSNDLARRTFQITLSVTVVSSSQDPE